MTGESVRIWGAVFGYDGKLSVDESGASITPRTVTLLDGGSVAFGYSRRLSRDDTGAIERPRDSGACGLGFSRREAIAALVAVCAERLAEAETTLAKAQERHRLALAELNATPEAP